MFEFTQKKTLVAKLLAQENITVVYRKVPTAAFDLQNRTLIIPLLNDMDEDVVDGLTCHEVGHALETPPDGWHNSLKHRKSLKSYLNVIEDARIERKMKVRFPGIVRSFRQMYRKLHRMNFFKLEGVNVDRLRLIDRINIFFKLGAHVRVAFTPEELKYIDRINAAETFEDAEAIAIELHNKAKEEYKKNPEPPSVMQEMNDLSNGQDDEDQEENESGEPDDSEGDEDTDDSESGESKESSEEADESESDESEAGEESEEAGDSDSDDTGDDAGDETDSDSDKDAEGADGEESDEESDGEGGESEDDESEDDDSGNSSGEGESDEDSDESDDGESEDDGDTTGSDGGNDDVGDGSTEDTDTPQREISDEEAEDGVESLTDNAFRENETSLVDAGAGETIVINPPKYNSSKYFVPHRYVQGAISAHIGAIRAGGDTRMNAAVDALMRDCVLKFIERTQPVVNYMVKEFEVRKNASAMIRTKVAKSGRIDPKKLSRFSLDTDIFQRLTTVPTGQNHGLVLFLDLSGSMYADMNNVFEQAILLSQFCRKLNIPFEVYGFGNAGVVKTRYNAMYPNLLGKYSEIQPNTLCVANDNFYIKQFLSSTMNRAQFHTAIYNMLYVGALYTRRGAANAGLFPITETLCSTPLDEAVIASMELVSKFKIGMNIAIVNCIFLTDGMGGVSNQYWDQDMHKMTMILNTKLGKRTTVFIEDKHSGFRVPYENLSKNHGYESFTSTRALIKLAQKVTGAKYTGYYLMAERAKAAALLWDYEYRHNFSYNINNKERAALREKMTDEGFLKSDKFGFTDYFFVLTENLRVDDEGIDVAVGATKHQITKAFQKSMNKRGLQRMFLNEFMETISKM